MGVVDSVGGVGMEGDSSVEAKGVEGSEET